VDSNSEIQGYNVYPMLHFHSKFSSGVTTSRYYLCSYSTSLTYCKPIPGSLKQGTVHMSILGGNCKGTAEQLHQNILNVSERAVLSRSNV